MFLVLRPVGYSAPDGRRARVNAASIAGAAIFLIHPLQTEAVSYVAGRSESLVSFFMLLAYVIFLYRREESISWLEAVAVLIVFAMAICSKENGVSLAGILVLTDVFWPAPIFARRREAKLAALPVDVARRDHRLCRGLPLAGDRADCRLFLGYSQLVSVRLHAGAGHLHVYSSLVFPFGQSIDHDYPTSYTIGQHAAIVYLMLLAAMVAGCIWYRRRYPLLCFGLLMFLIFLAPTSSIVPIDDSLVERRMYLPLVGLILGGCEILSHVSRRTAYYTVALAALLFGKLCYDRNQLWGEPEKSARSGG